MKKWPIVFTSTIIALALISFYIVPRITFSDEAVEYTQYLPVSVSESKESISSDIINTEPSEPVSETPSPSSTPVSVSEPPVSYVQTPSHSQAPLPISVPELPVEQTPIPEVRTSAILPVISISGETHVDIVTINNVVNLRGIVTTDSGTLTEISANIVQDDAIVQSCSYSPSTDLFSLAGTVNADLHFAQLGVGSYRYVLNACAENNSGVSEVNLIDDAFEIVSAGSMKSEEVNGGSGGYVAKISSDTDNAAIIWNFLIGQFDNPYAAAGIMANMEAESSLMPTASQGNTSVCGYGLCQWTEYRKERLNEFAKLADTDVSDIYLQLCFIIYELDNYYPKLKQFLFNVTDGNIAASEFCAIYEQSASYGNRGAYVKKYLDRFATP